MCKIAAIVFLVLIVLLVIAIIRKMEEISASMRAQRKIIKQCTDSCNEKRIADTTLDVHITRNLAERILKDNIRLTSENEKLREQINTQEVHNE